MPPTFRMTMATKAILQALVAEPATERYGLELCDLVGLPTGTVYPILARLEQAGLVRSRWEGPADLNGEGRPRRRYYQLDPEGAQFARDALAEVNQRTKSRKIRLSSQLGHA